MSHSELIDMGWISKKIILKLVNNKKVQVGFITNAKDMAYIAFLNEFGHKSRSPDGPDVPERPFMRNALLEHSASYRHETAFKVHSLLRGNLSVNSLLEQSGQFWQEKFKHSIVEFHDPGNADSTIKKKGRDDPLVDRGLMLAMVKYKLGAR